MTKYCWLETRDDANLNCETLSKELGIAVKEVTMGGLVVGEIDDIGEDGKVYKREIIRKGVEIKFENEPTAEQLAKVDTMLPELKREGVKTPLEEIAELKDRIASLEKIVIKS